MGLSTKSLLSIVGFSMIFTYVITNLLEFYGIGSNVYGSYVGFYLFLLVSIFVLPLEYPKGLLRTSNMVSSAPSGPDRPNRRGLPEVGPYPIQLIG
jgi:hypothetical protein